MAAPSMNDLASKYKGQGIGSIFVYTHEAHPGENYPHLTTMEQKYKHAQALKDIFKVDRPILLDSLEGDCHRAFGSMPNMSWIINRAGIPIYKSDWTDVISVDLAIQYYLSVKSRRRQGAQLSPFKVERLDYRLQDRDGFYKGLKRNGPKAVQEFDIAFK